MNALKLPSYASVGLAPIPDVVGGTDVELVELLLLVILCGNIPPHNTLSHGRRDNGMEEVFLGWVGGGGGWREDQGRRGGGKERGRKGGMEGGK